MRRLALVVACSLLAASRAGAQDGLPAQPLITDLLLTGQAGPSRSTVSRSILQVGRYLYVSGEPGLQTVDASDPGNLRLTSDWPHSSFKMNGAAAKGNVLYVTDWHPSVGLELFDISDPARPAHLRTIPTSNYSWDAVVHGNLLDVSLGNETKSAIATYDIQDPRNPVLINTLGFDDRLIGNATRHAGHLYFTYRESLFVYEAKDPAAPRRVRELPLGSLGGQTKIHRGHLFMVHKGVRVFSLQDPSSPKEVAYWEQAEPRGMHFQNDLLIIPASGSGIYTLDVSVPSRPREVSHWYVSWPGTGHGGYPVSVTGAGEYAFVAATGGNNPECFDFTCPCYGARVYSAKLTEAAPDLPAVPGVCRSASGGSLASITRPARPEEKSQAAQTPAEGAPRSSRREPAPDAVPDPSGAVKAAAQEAPEAVDFACRASPYAASLFPQACGESPGQERVSHAPRRLLPRRGR